MSAPFRVIVIGGGMVGAAVLYELARGGWTDCLLIERGELTDGSTWHAAAGFHTYNADPVMARLQAETIASYRPIEAESGQAVGMHVTGGVTLATTDAHWDWLQADVAKLKASRGDLELLSAEEAVRRCRIADAGGVRGGVFDPLEGRVDPHGVTHAFAAAARARGAAIRLRTRVEDMAPIPGGWRLQTQSGPVEATHVVIAAGLWARRVARMAGADLPVVPMTHHYLVTESVQGAGPGLPNIVDLATSCYLQGERDGVLLGIYEPNPRHWEIEGAPWDYGRDLLPPDLDRVAEGFAEALERFPAARDAGIRRWIHGPLTFTPDGNPLLGPIPGKPALWAACGVMAGFAQGAGIARVLARWMMTGEPGCDTAGFHVARFDVPGWTEASLLADTRQLYASRFQMA